MISQIEDNTIKKIYSKFNFFDIDLLHSYKSHKNFNVKEFIDATLFNYLKNFRFITYQITSNITNIRNFTENENIPNSNTIKVNAVICIEKECFIIENVYFSLIKLKEQKIAMFNMRKDYKNVNLFEEEKFIFIQKESTSSFAYFSVNHSMKKLIFFVNHSMK